MTVSKEDVCPMCGGEGVCELKPPASEGEALIILLEFLDDELWANNKHIESPEIDPTRPILSHEMNRLARLGYELFSFLDYQTVDGNDRTVVVMQWPIRWTVH